MVEEDTTERPFDSQIEISIVKDDIGRLATEFKSNLLEVTLSCGLHDETANVGATSEGNLANLLVSGKKITSNVTITSDNVENTRWEASFHDKGSNLEGRQRRHFRSLDDDDVTSCKSGSYLPSKHEKRT
jgi:hypothetical protein